MTVGAQTQEQQDAFAYIQDLLGSYDLGGLSDWAWQQIVQGASGAQVVQGLRQQEAYKNRFSGMAVRRQKGLSAITEAEYIAYERQARQILRDSGMPVGFWDDTGDFATLIGNDKSINELQQQITGAYSRVANAPTEVRQAFDNYFGTSGDTALAMFFLDPDRATPFLTQAAAQAEIGGSAAQFGLDVSQGTAAGLARRGVDYQRAQQGFAQVSELAPLFSETVSENQDLTAADTGVAAVFGTSAAAAEAIRKRREERAAQMGGGTQQGAAQTERGIVGLGSSNY